MFHLPEDFVHLMRDVHGTEAANAWFQRLPSFLEEYAQRWQLTLLPPFENLSFHYVAPALRADGTPAVLRHPSFPMSLSMDWPRCASSMGEASLVCWSVTRGKGHAARAFATGNHA